MKKHQSYVVLTVSGLAKHYLSKQCTYKSMEANHMNPFAFTMHFSAPFSLIYLHFSGSFSDFDGIK